MPSDQSADGTNRRYPVIGVCLRCDTEYFDLRRITTQCKVNDCGGYITGKTHEEIKEYRKQSNDTDTDQEDNNAE